MSEEITTTKISVTFERKLDLGSYQNVVARAWVEANVPEGDQAAQAKALGDAFGQAKAAVYDELGIEVLMDDAGVIREKFTPAVTTTQSGGERAARRAPENGGLGATGGFDTKGLEVARIEDMTQDIPDDIVAVCTKYGVTKVWANSGRYGQFYKEHVTKEDTPKIGVDDQGRTLIIKPGM
jgi:hypothetical protein